MCPRSFWSRLNIQVATEPWVTFRELRTHTTPSVCTVPSGCTQHTPPHLLAIQPELRGA